MKRIIIILVIFFFSCDSEPEKMYKYNICIGDAIFSVCYPTDTFYLEGEESFIRFVTASGRTKIVPKSHVYLIENK